MTEQKYKVGDKVLVAGYVDRIDEDGDYWVKFPNGAGTWCVPICSNVSAIKPGARVDVRNGDSFNWDNDFHSYISPTPWGTHVVKWRARIFEYRHVRPHAPEEPKTKSVTVEVPEGYTVKVVKEGE